MMMSSVLDRRHHTDPSVNSVNIPVSPAAKANRAGRELLYMELDLHPEPYGGPVSTNTTAARGNPVQLRRPSKNTNPSQMAILDRCLPFWLSVYGSPCWLKCFAGWFGWLAGLAGRLIG